MNITVENLPIFFSIMIVLGALIVVIGVIRLAGHTESSEHYTGMRESSESNRLAELFSFFLQEEEKKNQNFRQMVMEVSQQQESNRMTQTAENSPQVVTKQEQVKAKAGIKDSIMNGDQSLYKEIIKRYETGEDVESIAKSLKKGIGEVKLVISLYAMR